MPSLNPQIKTIEVGVRQLRQVTIYPLSMADQFKTTDLITEFVVKTIEFLETSNDKQTKDIAAVPVIVKGIEKNLIQILSFITEKGDKIKLDDLTNNQFSDLALLIFEINYEQAGKNFQALIAKVKSLLPSMGPSPSLSAEPTTDLSTSSVGALGMEG